MANSDQVKALIKSHIDGDDDRFFRISLQLAAHHARQGRDKLARELKDMVDSGRSKPIAPRRGATPIARPQGPLEDLLNVSYPDLLLSDVVLRQEAESSLRRFLKEHLNSALLEKHALRPRRKLLFYGPPGTGKTMTAKALAGELKLPLFVVRFDGLISRYLGETAAKLRLIFDAMVSNRGVYFFDEFDAIGAQRASSNDVGEIRRILTSFLQFIEEDASSSILIAATNHEKLLDRALFRRFDDVIPYSLPDGVLIREILSRGLAHYVDADLNWPPLVEIAKGLSQAELLRACEDAVKDCLIEGQPSVTQRMVSSALGRTNPLLRSGCSDPSLPPTLLN